MIRAALLAFIAATLLAACGEQRQSPAPEMQAKPALWVVEDAKRGTKGWLFGTIHALPDGVRWRTPALDRVISQAGVLVVEVRDLDPAKLAKEFERLASDRPSPPLLTRLAPSEQRQLSDLLEREDVDVRRFDGLETWAAALALAQLGSDVKPRNGVDKLLLAEFTDRPIRELEGAADQFAIFDTMAERDQRSMLAAVVAEQGRDEADADALARAWMAGDTARMERLARIGLLADPAIYEALLAKRNRIWVKAIAAELEANRRPLVAVGGAHLLGPDGLPALLAAGGYTVRRIQ